jgi:hypothetical protein
MAFITIGIESDNNEVTSITTADKVSFDTVGAWCWLLKIALCCISARLIVGRRKRL